MKLIKFNQGVLLTLSLFIASNVKVYAQSSIQNTSNEIYKSNHLIINQLTPNAYQHISYLQTNDFGLVPCNGLIVRDKNEVIIFDTPINDKSAEELIKWITTSIGCEIKAIIPTHFHEDCLGGLGAFIQNNIPSYGLYKTIALAKENNSNIPKNSFKNILKLKVGNEIVIARFFGEGHTKDNVVGYFTKDQILFGGCLIKEMNASKGFLGDANTKEWSSTVEKVKNTFPDVKIVVPGHGVAGDIKLLDYTISLFK
ncbi:MAG: subclass B1 metallo-beta-lactamase [Chitinophagaceae bacterium]